MATLGLVWSPEFDAFTQALKGLPEELATEADHLAEAAANGAAVAIKTVYAQHYVTGNLVSRVSVTQFHRGKLLPGWAVVSRSPITWIFEHGTVTRKYLTKKKGREKSTGAVWGRTPNPGPTFFPVVNRFRRALEHQLIDMVRRAGLVVKGA